MRLETDAGLAPARAREELGGGRAKTSLWQCKALWTV